jgi:hypothetical protein
MGGTCGTYGGDEKLHTGLWWGKLREREQLDDLNADGTTVLKWIFKK